MTTGDQLSKYYESLPAKRIGAGLVCRDAGNRVLLVQPTYKPAWELPGGVAEDVDGAPVLGPARRGAGAARLGAPRSTGPRVVASRVLVDRSIANTAAILGVAPALG